MSVPGPDSGYGSEYERYRGTQTGEELYSMLLDSAELASSNSEEVAGLNDIPLDPTKYGIAPEWSPLYGTPLWDSLSDEQRIRVTWHEFANTMSLAIWLECSLQRVLLRVHYNQNPGTADFQFMLNECGDECRHSLMFSQAAMRLVGKTYRPPMIARILGRGFSSLSYGETAMGITLAGEELLDAMQREFMVNDEVNTLVRETSRIHVLEESRHMTYARDGVKRSLEGVGRFRRAFGAFAIAVGTHVIGRSLVNPEVYKDAGLDWDEVRQAIDHNPHHRMMMRHGAGPLVEFLHTAKLTNPFSRWIYRKSNLL